MENIPIIEKNTSKSICTRGFLFSIIMCLGLSLFTTDFVDLGEDFFLIISGLLTIAYFILLVILSFKTAAKLEEFAKENNVDIKINKLVLFLFTVYYINFLINSIEEKLK